MTKSGIAGVRIPACTLIVALAATLAFGLVPVVAKAIGFTSGATQSSVVVIVSNQNPIYLVGDLTLVVEQANGVPRTWPVGRINIAPGNSTVRVLIPSAITGVRWVRLTNVGT